MIKFDKKIRLKYQSLCGIEGYDELRFMRLDCQTSEIFEKLRERGIIVRRWDQPRISEYLRISIGTDDEMDTLIAALKEILPTA